MVAFLAKQKKQVSDVFGVAPEVLADSYVDRGHLDEKISQLLTTKKHIALRGVSKCGKSWLRQRVVPEAIVVQCRLGKTVLDIYREALAQLGLRLEISASRESSITGTVEATAEVGVSLLAKLAGRFGLTNKVGDTTHTERAQHAINDLQLIAAILDESGKRLVIEDFHYLSLAEREKLAYDLKALWDFGTFVVIVGVWSGSNVLVQLNPDLSARVREVSIVWGEPDLRKIFAAGGGALKLEFGEELQAQAIEDCHGNAGILQRLIEGILEAAGITEEQDTTVKIKDLALLEDAALNYAEELNTLYLEFANRVSSGIRKRQSSTGIYPHAMAVVMAAEDKSLVDGVPLDDIFATASAREPRIQKGNLRVVLERMEALQVDDDGRGLVLAYNESSRKVSVVDRQLLLYRKYSTVRWPWEDLVEEAEGKGEAAFAVGDPTTA